MNFTASAYTGPRAVSFTASMGGVSAVVQSGSVVAVQAVAVHLGLRGENGGAGAAGQSAFDLWHSQTGNQNKTIDDFYLSLGSLTPDQVAAIADNEAISQIQSAIIDCGNF